MKKALFILVCVSILTASCSKCYDCKQTVDIKDAQGNVIDQQTVNEEVCTADKDEVNDKESQGFQCS